MIKKTIIILLLSPASLIAQRESVSSFDTQAGFYAGAYDVVWTMPENMIDLDTAAPRAIKREYRSASVYEPVLESRNQEFILMYLGQPLFVTDFDTKVAEAAIAVNHKLYGKQIVKPHTTNSWPRGWISGELKTAYGYNKNNKFLKLPRHLYKAGESKTVVYGHKKKDRNFETGPDKEFRFEDYVTIMSEKKARRWFNADTVFLYTLPVDDPYKEGYTHCTGMVITKKDRAGIGLMLYFTDQGKKKEAKYLRSLRKKIWYRNDAWKYDADIAKRTAQKYFGEEGSEE